MNKNIGKQLTTLAGAGVVIGTFLPWLNRSTPTRIEFLYGFEADGIITGVLGFIVLMIGLRRQKNSGKRYSITAGVLSILISLIAIVDIVYGKFYIQQTKFITSGVGLGIYFTLAAGVIGVLGGFLKTPSPENNP